MNIYIPTYGRIGKQKTFNRFPASMKAKTYFVIKSKEYDWYKKHTNPPIVVDKPGVPAARQAALEHCPDNKLFFFDDDLEFAYRPANWSMENYSLIMMDEKKQEEAIAFMEAKLNDYAIVAYDSRHMNHTYPEWFKNAKRVMRAFGIRKDILLEENLRFDKYMFWEDFHIALSLFKRGYLGYISLEYLHNSTASNAPGGVSTYRNFENLLQTRNEFVKEHTPFAVPIDKHPLHWSGTETWPFVPDVKIFWQKALESARNKI